MRPGAHACFGGRRTVSGIRFKMADGHILPLGNEVTLREADKSYVGKELQKEWNREKVEKEILPAVKRMGLFGKGDALHEK